ncbi:hypothetical protein KY290_021407 [Solanum tuberosum]|uniref:Polyprotein protein n=1 Tax=Solanum tuberosum TaxID=4113 RepID=A0ABQ7V305_SOLTU|nr:hypothetical protein KY290_021407 [Solanum tuberosum]
MLLVVRALRVRKERLSEILVGKPPTCRLKNLANKLYFIMARTGTSANKNLSTLEARICFKIVSSTLLPCKHTIDVTRERATSLLDTFVLGKLRRKFMMCAPFATHLVCCLVDVTRTKPCDPSQGSVLTAADKQARDDSWMGRMFGMAELQLRIGSRPVTKDEMATLAERYTLTDSAMYMCRMGPAFQEPLDDDDSTADEKDGSNEDASDDVGPGDDDTDVGDGDGDAASMAVDFATNMATR